MGGLTSRCLVLFCKHPDEILQVVLKNYDLQSHLDWIPIIQPHFPPDSVLPLIFPAIWANFYVSTMWFIYQHVKRQTGECRNQHVTLLPRLSSAFSCLLVYTWGTTGNLHYHQIKKGWRPLATSLKPVSPLIRTQTLPLWLIKTICHFFSKILVPDRKRNFLWLRGYAIENSSPFFAGF